jgi:hypothetical protein
MIKSDIHVSHMLNSGETQGNVIADKRIECAEKADESRLTVVASNKPDTESSWASRSERSKGSSLIAKSVI